MHKPCSQRFRVGNQMNIVGVTKVGFLFDAFFESWWTFCIRSWDGKIHETFGCVGAKRREWMLLS
jgi:hypothetical protein